MTIPTATYRIQLTPSFGFRNLQKVLPYLRTLGISHVYASPIFGARRGTTHGYDVVAPDQLNNDLGTPGDFDNLIAELHAQELGWLQDTVPNHMAFDSQNRLLMDILEYGERSPYYEYFDIDWHHPYESMNGKVLAPFLGKFYAECLESGEIFLDYDEMGFAVRYYDLRLPVCIESYSTILDRDAGHDGSPPGGEAEFLHLRSIIEGFRAVFVREGDTNQRNEIEAFKRSLRDLYEDQEVIRGFISQALRSINGTPGEPNTFHALDTLLSQQRFRLAFWKVATEEINYRRFFNINQLISLRIEDERVFRTTHSFILSLIWQKAVDGVRIDHIDGLYDPSAYLHRLRAAAPDAYVVVEKILDPEEALPVDWPIQGTTGYDFLNAVNGLLCERENDKALERIYFRFINEVIPYDTLVAEKKRLFLGRHMAGDIDRLALYLHGISGRNRYARDITRHGLRRALAELLAWFPVYRTYVSSHQCRESDRAAIEHAVRRASDAIPALRFELKYIEQFLTLRFDAGIAGEEQERWLSFAMRFQQYTGPLMAKGLEDTTLYIYAKLLSLNEVGGNARRLGVSPVEFHWFNKRRAAEWPYTMNALTTHDTKRGEDARARISVLSEIPKEWEQHARLWHRVNRRHKTRIAGKECPHLNDEYFFYQTLVGVFPISGSPDRSFTNRIKEYVIKAIREAKVHTAWLKPDETYESGFLEYIESVLNPEPDNTFLKDFIPFQKKIAAYGVYNSLAQTLLKITCPGIPDFYQGSELWDFSLVDPDNRRAVDYELRKQLLQDTVRGAKPPGGPFLGELLLHPEDGRIKMQLIHTLLAYRSSRRKLWQATEYIPLNVQGARKKHIFAFVRRKDHDGVLVAVPRLFVELAGPGHVPIGEETWQDTSVEMGTIVPTTLTDVLTGRTLDSGGVLKAADLFAEFPYAVLDFRGWPDPSSDLAAVSGI